VLHVSNYTRAFFSLQTVFVPSEDGRLYALTAATGAVLWQYSTAGPILTPALMTPSGDVLVTSTDTRVHIVHAGNGTARFLLATGWEVRGVLPRTCTGSAVWWMGARSRINHINFVPSLWAMHVWWKDTGNDILSLSSLLAMQIRTPAVVMADGRAVVASTDFTLR
jgi:hypothetical protein